MRSFWTTISASALTLSLAFACSANGSGVIESATGGAAGAGAAGSTSGGGSAGITFDGGGAAPNPDAACGYAVIPTTREPGTVLVVYDASCSMDECVDGNTTGCEQCTTGPSKWDQAKKGMTLVLNGLPNDVRMGLVLFPDKTAGGNCAEPKSAVVGIDTLDKTRPSILGYVSAGTKGGTTPTEPALDLAYGILQQVPGPGRRGVLLVTDGAWNCGSGDAGIYKKAEDNWKTHQISTFTVGLPGSADGSLSHLAHVGGADRVAGCNGQVPDPWNPFNDPSCNAKPDTCCHHVVGKNVETDLVKSLKEIASKFLTNCVFQVPKGTDPKKFDPSFVNVSVDGIVVPQNGSDGWSYLPSGTDSLEIHGGLCAEILAGTKKKVEIMLGCKTVVK